MSRRIKFENGVPINVANGYKAKQYDRETQEFANATAWLNDY